MIKLNIKKFSGGGTDTAFKQAQKISDNYAAVISSIQTIWNKIDGWSSAYASGETLKNRTETVANFLNGIPEDDGNRANRVLRERTDKIIRDANREDLANNNGNAQVSNPFEEKHLSCKANVPLKRSYKGIDDFTGLTDEGVAEIDTFNSALGDLSTKVDELFGIMGQGSVGTHITGLDLTESYHSVTEKDKATLSDNITEWKNEVDKYTREQENDSKDVSSY